MTTLHLGVIDLPYADAKSYRSVKRRKPKKSSTGSKTTGDVAEILEAKYGIMEFFWEHNEKKIMETLEESFRGAARTIALGGPIDLDPSSEAATKIEAMFRDMLTNRELDGRVPGVATQASKDGVSHRFAKPYAKRKSRPSFVDTGLYEGSFKAWVDQMINVSRESAMRAPASHVFHSGKGYFYLGDLPMPQEPIAVAATCEPPVNSIKGVIHTLLSPQNTKIRAGWDGLARVWMPIPNIGKRMAFTSAYLAAHGWSFLE